LIFSKYFRGTFPISHDTQFDDHCYRLSEKNVFGISPVENFLIFLSPNLSLVKKIKFSEFTSIFSSGSEKRFAHGKQKSADKTLKISFIQGSQENVRAARRDCHR
jgi:hypothetical protein